MNSNEARIMTAPRLGPVAHVAHAAHVGSLKPQTRQIFDQTKRPKAKGYKGRALGSRAAAVSRFRKPCSFSRDGPSAPPPSAQVAAVIESVRASSLSRPRACLGRSIQPPAKLHSEVKRFGTPPNGVSEFSFMRDALSRVLRSVVHIHTHCSGSSHNRTVHGAFGASQGAWMVALALSLTLRPQPRPPTQNPRVGGTRSRRCEGRPEAGAPLLARGSSLTQGRW